MKAGYGLYLMSLRFCHRESDFVVTVLVLAFMTGHERAFVRLQVCQLLSGQSAASLGLKNYSTSAYWPSMSAENSRGVSSPATLQVSTQSHISQAMLEHPTQKRKKN